MKLSIVTSAWGALTSEWLPSQPSVPIAFAMGHGCPFIKRGGLSFESHGPCDMLWPIESGGHDAVSVLSHKQLCTLALFPGAHVP